MNISWQLDGWLGRTYVEEGSILEVKRRRHQSACLGLKIGYRRTRYARVLSVWPIKNSHERCREKKSGSTDGGCNKDKGLTPLPAKLRRREDSFSCLRKAGLGMGIVSVYSVSFIAEGGIRRKGGKEKNEWNGDRGESEGELRTVREIIST